MSVNVSPGEIYLEDTRFPLAKSGRNFSLVSKSLISTFPSKVVIGEYGKDTEQIASSWIISDQRGGILVEEMEEAIHLDRCYWSDCDLRFKGHIILPPLETDCGAGGLASKDAYFITSYSDAIYAAFDTALRKWNETDKDFNDEAQSASWVSPTGFTDPDTAWTDEAYAYDDDTGTKAQCAFSGIGWGSFLVLEPPTALYCSNLRYYASRSDAHITQIDIDADYGDGYVGVYSGAVTVDTWTTVELGASHWVEKVEIRFYNDRAVGYIGYLNEFDFGISATTPALVSNPTDALVYQVSGTDKLFIACSTDYYYFDGISLRKNTDDAEFFVEWDEKLFKIDKTGQLAYSTNGTSWTNNGKIKLPDNYVTSLFTYRDADGTVIIYAGTKVGYWAHDYTKFLKTELSLPDHPSCGKGACVWRDAMFGSAGLDVPKYIAGSTATISFIGLNKDGGLPTKYRGEINKLISSYNEFFALVDASLVTGEGYSTVMSYDGTGWQCKWADGTADKPMKCGLVSSTHAYYLWFGANNRVYRIPLQRDIRNPLKITGSTYRSAGVHITPWFDADTAHSKLALRMKMDCDGMLVTAPARTVTVSYRINHSSSGIDDTNGDWTALGAVVSTDGETELSFGDGISFRSIQFRFDLASALSTATPDILKATLVYQKLLPAKWGYTCTIDCSQEYGGKSPSVLVAKIITLAETETLLDFTFRDETGSHLKSVKIANCQGLENTGFESGYEGRYSLSLVSP